MPIRSDCRRPTRLHSELSSASTDRPGIRDATRGRDYLVLEFLDGQSLAARLRRGPLTLREALTSALEVAQALRFAVKVTLNWTHVSLFLPCSRALSSARALRARAAIMSWEQAIRKSSWLPASTIGMSDRGLIARGMAADLAIIDPHTIIDRATYEDPALPSEGIRHVLVNGRVAIDGQEVWRERPLGVSAIRGR